MEIRKPEIKAMKYEDFNDNEYLEKMVAELRDNNTNVIVGCLDELIEWGRSNSLWPLTFATSCCGIEFMAVGAARYDFAGHAVRPKVAAVLENLAALHHARAALAEALDAMEGRA